MQLFNKAPTKKGDMGHFSKISFYRVDWESVIENGKLINTIFAPFDSLLFNCFVMAALCLLLKLLLFIIKHKC